VIHDSEITCPAFCKADSILFYQELYPEGLSLANIRDSINGSFHYSDYAQPVTTDLLLALRYYPELAHVRINFTCKAIRQTMNSRPSPLNIFRKRSNRTYNIIVNNNKGKQKGLLYRDLTYNIKTGWIGHELSHICWYEKMNTWQTLKFVVKYLCSKKFVRKVERNTDLVTIEHGLAFPLYDGVDYLLRNKQTCVKYRKYAITNYLSLDEIKCHWNKIRNKMMLDGNPFVREN
jgi:hypothetical protein